VIVLLQRLGELTPDQFASGMSQTHLAAHYWCIGTRNPVPCSIVTGNKWWAIKLAIPNSLENPKKILPKGPKIMYNTTKFLPAVGRLNAKS